MRLINALKRPSLSLLSHLIITDWPAATMTTGAVTKETVAQELKQLAASTAAQWSPAHVAHQLRAMAAQLEFLPETSSSTNVDGAQSMPVAANRPSAAAPLQSEGHPAQLVAPANLERLESSYHASPSLEGLQHISKKQRKGKPNKDMDFTQYRQRFVALEIAYLGTDFQGFARQADSDNTIEGHFFAALRHARLIPPDVDINSLRYSRCGRTDKGVSALCQVVALMLRSSARMEQEEAPPDKEMDYPGIINRNLPEQIRVLGWITAPEDFSARFSAMYREYLYFIIQDGTLDISLMNEAASMLMGEHDFRNLCKVDVIQVQNYRRRVLHAAIECVPVNAGGAQMYALRLRGTAFLWHQVRCIAAVLLMVGRRLEKPSMVARMLDITAMPAKPQYNMAPEGPLLLHRCSYGNLLPPFIRSQPMLHSNQVVVGEALERHLIGAALHSTILTRIRSDKDESSSSMQQDADTVIRGKGGKVSAAAGLGGARAVHTPMLRRALEPTMEERFEKAGLDIALLAQPHGANRPQACKDACATFMETGGD